MEQAKLTGYPSVDRPWLKYYDAEALRAPLPACTVCENVWRHNRTHLSDAALEYCGRTISYRKLFSEVDRCARALRQNGVQTGDQILLCMTNVPEAVYLVLAVSKIGAVANCLNPLFPAWQTQRLIRETGARFLFLLDRMAPHLADAVAACAVTTVLIPAAGSLGFPRRLASRCGTQASAFAQRTGKPCLCYESKFLRAGHAFCGTTEAAYAPCRPVITVYSSGTTGDAKGIQLTNDGVNALIHEFTVSGMPFHRPLRSLDVGPIWLSTGVVFNLLLPLCTGMVSILEPSIFDVNAFCADVAKRRPTHMIATPSLWLAAAEHPLWKTLDLSFLRLPMAGGEALPPAQEDAVNAFFAARGFRDGITKGYGMCELGSAATAASLHFNKRGSVGIPLPHVLISAFDPETDAELPFGQRGELRVATPCRMLGYYQDPAATEAFFFRAADGRLWGRTGDVGYLDEDGNVFVLGRVNDSFVAQNGLRCYFFDTETVIRQDSAVSACKVVAIDAADGPLPVAHLILHADCADPAGAVRRIAASCADSLPAHAVPKGFKLRKKFPMRTSTGKRDIEALKAERDGFADANNRPLRV